jgi:hypothetical protein
MNSVTSRGFVKVAPPSVDLATTTAFTCLLPRPSNERHVTYTVPALVTPMSQNWTPWTPSEIF